MDRLLKGDRVTEQDVNLTKRSMFLADGQIVPVLSKFVVGRERLYQIFLLLSESINVGDFVFLALVGWATVPLLGVTYGRYYEKRQEGGKPYEETYVHHGAHLVSQAANLTLVVYVVDCFIVVLRSLDFHLGVPHDQISKAFAKIIYIAWAAYRLSIFKRYLLSQAVSRQAGKLGRASMIDRLLDGIITVVTILFLLDILDMEMGFGVKSVLTFGSAGTLIVGLATKDVAAMFVSGLTLTTSNRISEGDEVRFGDGTTGFVQKVGWMQTTIRHYDELIEVIPNSDLGSLRVTNVSRCKRCQVKQYLRFRYEDAEKFPVLLPAILQEIKESCPKVITKGRPFRAVWTGYRENYLEVMVDVHFEERPTGQPYWETKQAVMEAIYRAVKKSGAEFVTTFYPQLPGRR
jgi:small-conductance mechanosensitive channel